MLFILIIICTSVYMGICAFFFFTQRSFIYFPRQQQNHTVDQIQVNTDQSVVRLSVSNPKSTRAILYFGGNAEDVSLSLPEYARRISGVAIYMVHYRGYGGSTGSPSEAGLRHRLTAFRQLLNALHHSYQYDSYSVIRTAQLIWSQTFNVQRLFWPLLMMK